MCCGQKRSALRSTLDPAIASPAPPATNPRPAQTVQTNAARHASNNFQPPGIPRTPRGAAHPPSRPPAQAPYLAVRLRYLENAPIRVQGHITGRPYDFSGVHPVRTVDARDASALLHTRLFRQV
jgi:hypothetical protein